MCLGLLPHCVHSQSNVAVPESPTTKKKKKKKKKSEKGASNSDDEADATK